MTRRRRTLIIAASAVGFLVASALIRGGLVHSEHFGDVGLYADDAHRIVNGQIPYRDFFYEYPPGSLVVVILPALVSTAHYATLFKVLMAVCGVATIVVTGRVSAAMGHSYRRTVALYVLFALVPVAAGPLLLDEYDLWPALITVGGLALLLAGRERLGSGLLGFGVATKVFPVLILPAALVWLYRRSGRRAALYALATAVAVAAATYVVFVALGPGGVWYSLQVQARRGLQKESFGAATLFVLDKLGLYNAHIVEGAHWTELTGPAGNALALLGTICQVAGAALVAALVARRRPDTRTLVYAFAAAATGFVAFGKVFSPQYLIWLVPLVIVVGRALEIALLAAALVLTQLWFLGVVTPFDLDQGVWILVARDLLVIALFAALVLRLRGEAAQAMPRTAPRAPHSVPAAPT
jgi:uncharacterized membrane protein